MNVNSLVDAALETLLESNGWKAIEDPSGSLRFCRQHEIDDYLWTEELNFNILERLTYIQRIRTRRSDLDKALGETAKRFLDQQQSSASPHKRPYRLYSGT
jgi:hypothetical protein